MKMLADPLYYLQNFQTVLEWIKARYGDLLTGEEQTFMQDFASLPDASRALLVRMVMRKGDLFRASKLDYAEIGSTHDAASLLVAMGWIDDDPLLTLQELFSLLKKAEITQALGLAPQQAGMKKADLLDELLASFPEYAESRRLESWHADTDETIYRVRIGAWCNRLRLMFFGNLRQNWSEFVLADLGIYRYEKVEFSPLSRGFRSRQDVDDYLHLHQCRERFRQGEPADDILAAVFSNFPAAIAGNDWLEGRRSSLLFQIGRHCERDKAWPEASRAYSGCSHPGARIRAIRVLERCEEFASALALAQPIEHSPENEAEKQQLLRILPRLRRRLGQPSLAPSPKNPIVTMDLNLPRPEQPFFVEFVVREHLSRPDAPVHYVENTLINSLFGLLCWDAIFAAVPGAFFHPFHVGPTDLLSADFARRREREFAECFSALDSGQYPLIIRQRFRDKAGIQSPFVFWEMLNQQMLDLALKCLPAEHLKQWFARILQDIQANRSGLPDLIQFFPEQGHYRMIEVKGPGDRLQDNQIRWLDYCTAHDMPVSVCHVQWAEGDE
jgi:hypothetical protein